MTTLPDLEKYRPFMDGFTVTDEEKDEVTLALWRVAQHFIDKSLGLSPVQFEKTQVKQSLDP